MKTETVVLLASAALSSPCWAQDDYRIELFGGYVNQRGDGTETRNGWIASETVYIRPWIGITGEFTGLYNKHDRIFFQDSGNTRADLDDNQNSYLFGPTFRLLSKKRFTLGVHSLFGVAHRESDSFIPASSFNDFGNGSAAFVFTRTATQFAGAVGISLDWNISERFSWRLQPDWHFVNAFGTRQDSLRVSTGLVFRFGR